MEKSNIIFLLAMLVFITIFTLTTIMPLFTSPIRRPQPMVASYILRLTPIGMHIDDVIDVIEGREDWGVRYIARDGGFVHPHLRGEDHGWPTVRPGSNVIVGQQSIRVNVGAYQAWYKLFFVTHVDVFWGFDEDGYLIEIYVWKSIDVL